MDLISDTGAILNSYYGMLRGHIHTNLPPEHSTIAIWNNRIQNGRRIAEKVYWVEEEWMLTYVYQIIRRDSKVSASVPSTQGT